MERTLVLLKPDAVARGLVGKILSRVEDKGLHIVGLRMMQVSEALASKHYAVHKDKPFYAGLLRFITSGPVVAACVEGKSAVSVVRRLVGSTNAAEAQPGSIRGDLANSNRYNLIHASDSAASAAEELANFFGNEDLVGVPEGALRWVYDSSEGGVL